MKGHKVSPIFAKLWRTVSDRKRFLDFLKEEDSRNQIFTWLAEVQKMPETSASKDLQSSLESLISCLDDGLADTLAVQSPVDALRNNGFLQFAFECRLVPYPNYNFWLEKEVEHIWDAETEYHLQKSPDETSQLIESRANKRILHAIEDAFDSVKKQAAKIAEEVRQDLAGSLIELERERIQQTIGRDAKKQQGQRYTIRPIQPPTASSVWA